MTAEQQPHGTSALSGIAEVWNPESPDLQTVYQAIPAATGVPGVHLVWRLLGGFPAFLIRAWPDLAVALTSAPLRSAAGALLSASFLPEAVGLPSHKAFRGDLARAEIDAELRERIEYFNDTSQLGVSRLLALMAATRAGVHRRSETAPAAQENRFVPSEVVGVYVPPLRHGEAVGKAKEILETIESAHGLPWLDDYYRSVARIPDYLSAAWNAIRPIAGDPAYLERAVSLRDQAGSWEGAERVAAASRDALDACAAGERPIIARLLDALVDAVLPQTLIDITLIKALTSGPDSATSLSAQELR